jgi:UPF0755 protein
VSGRSRAGRHHHRRPPRRASGGRTLLWLLLFLVLAGAAVAGAMRLAGGDDAPVAQTTAPAEVPVRVTFPEGLRREEIAAIVAERTGIAADAYLRLTGAGPRGARLAGASRPTSLEGFLFPATYDVFSATTAQDLVDQQVRAYEDNTAGIDYRYARSKNLTDYDVLILASMVEREVRVPAERKIVAGVMYNRLRNRMRLDIDATVQYALGEWKPELTAADLAVDSPYNTRRFPGLPPGPICNPGIAAIAAAANPARVPYLYYVARNDGTGRHYFATTPEEFEQAVARARANGG